MSHTNAWEKMILAMVKVTVASRTKANATNSSITAVRAGTIDSSCLVKIPHFKYAPDTGHVPSLVPII
jgi:hypothetical protein